MRSVGAQIALLLACLLVVLGLLFGAGWWLVSRWDPEVPGPAPVAEGCVARAGDVSYFLTPEQAKWASVIVAESIRRDLPPRAASIALATAMQESSLRNIDYGDRDSVGLFQQRPSQGWGTVEQIMDPWYSSGKFYDHLVKVKGWQTGDINDVAQKVQRSGVPDGYRKHEENAKALASVLTGHTPAGLSCAVRQATPEKSVHQQVLTKGLKGKVAVSQTGGVMTLTAKSPTLAWAAGQLMMASVRDAKVRKVEVGREAGQGQRWIMLPDEYAVWGGTPAPAGTVATITFG